MSQTENSYNSTKLLQRSRWNLLFRGIILLLIGAVMFGNPESFFRALTMIIGVVLLIDGIFIIGTALTPGSPNPASFIIGAILLVIGFIAFFNPQGTNMLIACAIGLWIFISALQDIYLGFTARKNSNWFWLIPAILMLLVGGMIFCAPWIGIEIAGIWMGVMLLFSGAFTIAAAISIWNIRSID